MLSLNRLLTEARRSLATADYHDRILWPPGGAGLDRGAAPLLLDPAPPFSVEVPGTDTHLHPHRPDRR